MADCQEQCLQISLRRMDTSQPWGFRLKGGADQGIPLHVEQCGAKGRAGQAGLRTGDMIVSICGIDTQNFSHPQVKQEVLRAGNELDFVVRRGALTGPAPVPQQTQQIRPQQPQGGGARVEICEEPTLKIGGPTYKKVTPKTYQVIDQELTGDQSQGRQQPAAGPKPASIFDRKRQERSAYLQAKGPTIQKAFGES